MLIKKLIPFILCVIILIPLFGCSSAENTVVESASAPENDSNFESSKPTPPTYDTEPPVMEELNNKESDVDEYIPSIDELIANDYALLKYPYDDSMEAKWEPNEKQQVDVAKDAVYLAHYYTNEKGVTDLQSIDILFEGEIVDHYGPSSARHIVSENKIMVVKYDGSIHTLYTSPDNEKITKIVVGKNFIYFVEGGYLNIMTYDGSDIREICEIGDVTNMILLDTNTILYRAGYYNGELLSTTSWYTGPPIDGVYPQKEPTPFDEITYDCFIMELSTKEKTSLTLDEFLQTDITEETTYDPLPKA